MRFAVIGLVLMAAITSHAKPVPRDRQQPPPPPPAQENLKLPASYILPAVGSQCSPARAGTQTGLLIDFKTSAGRVFVEVLDREPSETGGLYMFFNDGHNGSVVYEPNGTMLESTGRNPWKLVRPAYLVEVQINGGKGMPESKQGGAAFVASKVRIIDRSKEHPIDPSKVILDARARFDKLLVQSENAIAAALIDAHTHTPGRSGQDAQNIYEHFYPTWWADKQQLEVLYTRVYLRYSATQRYGVEIGHKLTYDNTGKLVDERAYPPRPIRVGDQNAYCAYP